MKTAHEILRELSIKKYGLCTQPLNPYSLDLIIEAMKIYAAQSLNQAGAVIICFDDLVDEYDCTTVRNGELARIVRNLKEELK